MRRVLHLVKNARVVLANTDMLVRYVKWLTCKFVYRRSPIVSAENVGRIGNFISFSEYWTHQEGPSKHELDLFRQAFCSLSDRKETIAFDVGANIGSYSLAMANIGFKNIHAFEPVRETYDRLMLNLRINSDLSRKITPVEVGLGSKSSSVTFAVNAASPGQNRIAVSAVASQHHELVECQVKTLEEYVAQNRIDNVGFLKIDVEGFESDVLVGAKELLKAGRILFVYLEIIPKALAEAGSSVEELTAMLRSFGYFPVRANDYGGGFSKCSLDDALCAAGNTRNAMFAHTEQIVPR